MIILRATEEDVLHIYRKLNKENKEDVLCSTTILQLNQGGSIKIKHSWIWQSVNRQIHSTNAEPINTDNAKTVLECEFQPLPYEMS